MTAGTRSVALTADELGVVEGVMAAAGVRLAGALSASVISGGRSNETHLLTDGVSRWVMRTPPRVGRTPSAHDVAREYRVTSALGPGGFPVPTAVALCEAESLIGGAFAIWDFVEGRTVQSRANLAPLDDATVGALSSSIIETLAALHHVDYVAAGLGRFGRPEAYAERQLRRWSGQWKLVGLDDLKPEAADLVARLERALPEQRATGIVHGDYRIDNLLLDLTGQAPRVAAVVDWELSTIGDPVADVAMMCAYRHRAFDLIVGSEAAWTSDRLPAPDQLAAMYVNAGGVPLENWTFHLALAYFKIGVIAAGIDHRRRFGGASGAGFDTAGESVVTYFELARATIGDRS